MSRGDKRHPVFFWNVDTTQDRLDFTGGASRTLDATGAGANVQIPVTATGCLLAVGNNTSTFWVSPTNVSGEGFRLDADAGPSELYIGLEGDQPTIYVIRDAGAAAEFVNVIFFY